MFAWTLDIVQSDVICRHDLILGRGFLAAAAAVALSWARSSSSESMCLKCGAGDLSLIQ